MSGTQYPTARVIHSLPQAYLPHGDRPSVAIQRCAEPDVESITQWPEFRDDRRNGRPPFRWVPVVPTPPFRRDDIGIVHPGQPVGGNHHAVKLPK